MVSVEISKDVFGWVQLTGMLGIFTDISPNAEQLIMPI
jgi:hypothetical protein